jgi:hypothetical protein
MTVLSVFTKERLGIPGFAFIKELLLLSLIVTIVGYHIFGKVRVKISRYDIGILAYIAIMLVITSFTTGLSGAIYGGRYDFAFLIAFMAAYHGRVFLEKPVSYYIRIFLISGGAMILISLLLKWPLSEDYLLFL